MAENATKKKPSRLGRGLSSLMATPVAVEAAPTRIDGDADKAVSVEAGPPVDNHKATASTAKADKKTAVGGPASDGLVSVDVGDIEPNPHQPREYFDESAMQALADSILADGVMQPIVIRPGRSGGADYEIVAGERRWRAAKRAGLSKIPALLRPLDDRQSAEWALIENLQREDLNPIERAEAFRRLSEGFGLNHEEVAQRVGLDRSTVTNLLRLLRLSPDVRGMVAQELLSMGQARAIAGLEDAAAQLQLAKRAVKEGQSVRQVEAAVRDLVASADSSPGNTATKSARSAYLDDLERQVGEHLQTKVAIKTGRKKGTGTLSIDFYSLDQFDELLEKLGVEKSI